MEATCACGKVVLGLVGNPVLTTTCYCADCQSAAFHFEKRFGRALMTEDGGTDHVLWPKKALTCLSGAEELAEYRLNAHTHTRRVVATCCGTPMFLDYTKGSWVTLYRDRLAPENRPRIEMRVMLRDRVGKARLPDDCRNLPRYSPRIFACLLRTAAQQGFRRYPIAFVKRVL